MSLRPDDHRRKWDRSTYERLAQDRIRGQKAEKEDEDGKPFVFIENLKPKIMKSNTNYSSHFTRTTEET